MLPKWNPNSGGTGPWNSLDAWRITPSPPRHTMRSTPAYSVGVVALVPMTRARASGTLSTFSSTRSLIADAPRDVPGAPSAPPGPDAPAAADRRAASLAAFSSRISPTTFSSTTTSNPMDNIACDTSTSCGSSAGPSFFSTSIRFGGLRHTSTSCCVLGCEIFSIPSSTSSRVHVNPSVRMTYMSGACSRLLAGAGCVSAAAAASALTPPLPMPSPPDMSGGGGGVAIRASITSTSSASATSRNPAPSYAAPAPFTITLSTIVAAALRLFFARRSANDRTNVSCAMLPKSQHRDSSASA
eukprot:30274-Pelagococcus_subviridis.AAC.1